jgi:GNAT superfamily N-acetyltransferase
MVAVGGLGQAAAVAEQPSETYTTKPLTPETWPDFAALVEANNGVWGGCWCIGFHAGGITRDSTAEGNREAKRAHVDNGTVHQILVYADDVCRGWIQYGPPAEVATIKNPKAYEKELVELPDWRIGCVFTHSRHRGQGVARAGLAAVLDAIGRAGGGTVEAYPEQVEGRGPQRGAYLHTGPETLFEDFGFVRDRRIAKWRWVMRRTVASVGSGAPS